jgi:hypothetical protein
MFANVLFLALDPVFVSRIAEGLELDSEGIGLIERRRSTDPTLTTLLWHCGPESRPAPPLTDIWGGTTDSAHRASPTRVQKG